MPRLHLSCVQLPADRGKRQKRGFACARIIFIISAILHSTFYIYHLRRRADVNSVTLSGAASGNREPRSRTGLLRSLLCHFDLVVTRLCCQHFAVWQNARLARRLLLFPKISLRCDFREPCLIARRVEKSCAVRCGKQTLLPCLERLTVLYKIPRLTLGMTRTVFVFRDPSTRAGCARARSG